MKAIEFPLSLIIDYIEILERDRKNFLKLRCLYELHPSTRDPSMLKESLQKTYPVGGPLVLRVATKDDMDAIFWIVKDGFKDDPIFNYKSPHRLEYPDDFSKWTRREYEEYLEQPDKYVSLVVTTTIAENGVVAGKPIAIGVWDVAVETKSTGGGK